MEKSFCSATTSALILVTLLLIEHPTYVYSSSIQGGSIAPGTTLDRKSGYHSNISAASQQKITNSRLFTPFRHLQVGASGGLTVTHMGVSGFVKEVARRFTFGADIRPLPFFTVNASISNARVSDVTNSHDTIDANSSVVFRTGTSSNTTFRTYSAGANIILPVLFWKNWPEQVSKTNNSVCITLGGIREWITITDGYSVDSLGKSSVERLVDVDGSVKEQRWSGSVGILYRHSLPYPFKGWIEAGGEYVRPYSKTVTFSGTQNYVDSSPPTTIRRNVTVHQEFPVQFKASLLFRVY